MGHTLLVIIGIAIVLLAVIAILILSPSDNKKSANNVEIHVSHNAEVKIIQSPQGLRFDIIYETTEEKPADFELIPDLTEDDIEDPSSVNNDFWMDIAAFETLPIERREAIANKLVELGFIKKENAEALIYEAEPLIRKDDEKGDDTEYDANVDIPEDITDNNNSNADITITTSSGSAGNDNNGDKKSSKNSSSPEEDDFEMFNIK